MNTRICPETGAELRRGIRAETLTYKGLTTTFEMPGWYPEGSDEGIHSGEDMKVSDRALNRLKAQSAGLLTPEEIKRVRKALHLTQGQAGALIGGGPNAFQKYEAGDLLPSKALCNLLRVLSQIPNAMEVLKKSASTQELGKAEL